MANGALVDGGAQEMQQCVRQLNHKICTQFASSQSLEDVVKFCLTSCEMLHQRNSIEKLLVKTKKLDSRAANELDYDATVAAIMTKPMYSQLLSVVRRALMSSPDDYTHDLLARVLDWMLATPTTWIWSWVFIALARANEYVVQEFLFRQVVLCVDTQIVSVLLPVLEYFATKFPAQTLDIVRDLLDDISSPDSAARVHDRAPSVVLTQLLHIASDSSAIVRACDDSFQWIFTKDTVQELQAITSSDSIQINLMNLIRRRSAELVHSSFQMITLIQELSDVPTLAGAAYAFHEELLAFAAEEKSKTFLKHIHRYLPYICQTTLRLALRDINDPHSQQKFACWRQWLVLICTHISRTEATNHLLEADLMVSNGKTQAPGSDIDPSDQAFCDLLRDMLISFPREYAAFLQKLLRSCQSSSSRGQQTRFLVALQCLLARAKNDSAPAFANGLPLRLRSHSEAKDNALLKSFLSVDTWEESWLQFRLWRVQSGAELWEGFLDLCCAKDLSVASRALTLLSRIPFVSLEDPAWQYQCLRKVVSTFFHVLRQYRSEMVHCAQSDHKRDQKTALESQKRLEVLKRIVFRLLVLDGGVAHYASSVFGAFVSLWIDSLWNVTAPTSVPTHFPSQKHNNEPADFDLIASGLDRVVIRSERTISSKCTNLQSSKVITHFPETIVYRKTLDKSWEQEMDAARACSVYATDLLNQVLGSTTNQIASWESDLEHRERRLKATIDLLLERSIPCCGIPSDETYKELLPHRSSVDMDLRIEQWLNHYPAFLPLLRLLVSVAGSMNSSQALRLLPLIKSALVVLVGHWNSVKGDLEFENMDVPPYMRNRNQLALTCELVDLLGLAGWVPLQLGRTAELLPHTTPADIRSILFSCWYYLADHPPSVTNPVSTAIPLDFFLVPLRKALRCNMRKIGAKYALFMC